MGATDRRRVLKEACDLFGAKVVAAEMRVSEAVVDAWVRGDATMPEDELLHLARALLSLASAKR